MRLVRWVLGGNMGERLKMVKDALEVVDGLLKESAGKDPREVEEDFEAAASAGLAAAKAYLETKRRQRLRREGAQ